MRRSPVGQVRRKVARIGGSLRAVEIFQAGEKSPRFGFAHRALADVNVRSRQGPDLARLRRLPFVAQMSDRAAWFEHHAQVRPPLHAVGVVRGLNELDTSSRRLRESRLAGTDFPRL